MKICPKCAFQNEEGAKFCSICGAPLVDDNVNSTTTESTTQNNVPSSNSTNPYTMPQNTQTNIPPNENSETHFYQKSWFIILCLVLFFPVGAGLMWIYKKDWKLSVKVILTVIFALVFIGSIGNSGSDDNDDEDENSVTITTEAETDETTTTTTTTTVTTTETTTEATTTTTELTTTETTTVVAIETEMEETTTEAVTEEKILHFILNTKTGCVHIRDSYSAAEQIDDANRQEIDIPESELSSYAGTYWACGKCSKAYQDELPKWE
ncbi:MAG: zinc-ribbon domain-containing protein [Ruminococcus sp.]|nr:zinc-ribbon domain-containing protein [Ruminococcus sp.]